MHPGDRAPHGDDEPELITPEDLGPRNPFPADAQRLGFDRYSGGDAGMIALAASLNGSKPSHRLIAAVLLVLVVGFVVWTLWSQFTA